MRVKFSKKTAFLSLLLLIFLVSIPKSYSLYPEVTVHNGEDIVISLLVKNTGSKPQENWRTGIEFYKVSNYNNPKGTRDLNSEIYALIKHATYPQFCYEGDPSSPSSNPIPLDECYCYVANPALTEILDHGEEVNITCVIKSSFWLEKWGFSGGSDRIIPWVHETVDEWDLNKNGG